MQSLRCVDDGGSWVVLQVDGKRDRRTGVGVIDTQMAEPGRKRKEIVEKQWHRRDNCLSTGSVVSSEVDEGEQVTKFSHIRATITLVASPAFAKEAAFVHDEAHLSSDDIATATGAAPSTARAWVALKRIPSGARAKRIAELSSLSERLLRVMDPEYIPVWMNKPVPALDDRKPLELISEGEYLQVARIVSALEEPIAS